MYKKDEYAANLTYDTMIAMVAQQIIENARELKIDNKTKPYSDKNIKTIKYKSKI